MPDVRAILLIFSIFLLLWLQWLRSPGIPLPPAPAPKKKKKPRLHPRTPKACPQCRAGAQAGEEQAAQRPAVIPWSQVKGPGGPKKTVNTEGHACPCKACVYYGIRDAEIHALVGCGTHGKKERIQDLRCQACRTKFSVRLNTPLHRLKTSAEKFATVLSALAEGLDVAAAARVFGVSEATIDRWRERAARHAEIMHRHFFRDLVLEHVQLDELRARLRERIRITWLWVAMDVKTKVIAAMELGPRTQDKAHSLIHKLCQVLADDCMPLFTSDGLNQYFYALTAHFGKWVQEAGKRKKVWVVSAELIYGQLKKQCRRRKLVGLKYEMLVGTFAQLKERLLALGLSGKLNTAFVERVNLPIRQGIAALIRRTWSTALTEEGLWEQAQWWRGYYHFVRFHMSLRVELAEPVERQGGQIPKRYRSRTPAVAAGVTRRRWTALEFLSYPMSEALIAHG